MTKKRYEVFLCECGDEIEARLDLELLADEVGRLPAVGRVNRIGYACSPEGLRTIQTAIADQQVAGCLIAGCTPRLMQRFLNTTFKQASTDSYLIELVDIRESCAWCHPQQKQAATSKARGLIEMGIARFPDQIPAPATHSPVLPAALVVGDGSDGLLAALTLAEAGIEVKLICRNGTQREARSTPLPGEESPNQQIGLGSLKDPSRAVFNHPLVEVFHQSQVQALDGHVGAFRVAFLDHSSAEGKTKELEVGAIILAPGAEPGKPGWPIPLDGQRVLSQWDLEPHLQDWRRRSAFDGDIGQLAFLLCRHHLGNLNSACTGFCCASAVRQAIAIKTLSPTTRIGVFYHELVFPGGEDAEGVVASAHEAGVELIRLATDSSPRIVEGRLEWKTDPEAGIQQFPFDHLILTEPLGAARDADRLAHIFRIDQDQHGFFKDPVFPLRPDKNLERGIYICGSAHYPVPIEQAEFQALKAAFSALRLLRKGQITTTSPSIKVEPTLCTGCGTCLDACPFNAVYMLTSDAAVPHAWIDPFLCKACGNCVVCCPVHAIQDPLESDAQILRQIEAALHPPVVKDQPRIILFSCEWSGQLAAELAGARRLAYPVGVIPVRLSCAARFNPLYALWAFHNGAEGVMLAACPVGSCHYKTGNRSATDRFLTLHGQLSGFDPRRLRLGYIQPDDPDAFVDQLHQFNLTLQALDPVPWAAWEGGEEFD